MTTIFADVNEGVMVCDSKMTINSEWIPVSKVVRVGQELIGFAGLHTEGERWLAWYKGGMEGPRPKVENSNALVLGLDGLRLLDASGGFVRIERGFMGAGSGGIAATAAFIAGADAETAVYIACQIDANSGGEIVVHRLKG